MPKKKRYDNGTTTQNWLMNANSAIICDLHSILRYKISKYRDLFPKNVLFGTYR